MLGMFHESRARIHSVTDRRNNPHPQKSQLEVDSQELRCDYFRWLFMPPWVFFFFFLPFFLHADFKCSELLQRSVASRAFMRPELWGMRLVTGRKRGKKTPEEMFIWEPERRHGSRLFQDLGLMTAKPNWPTFFPFGDSSPHVERISFV